LETGNQKANLPLKCKKDDTALYFYLSGADESLSDIDTPWISYI